MCMFIRQYGVQAWNALMAGRTAVPQVQAIISTPTEAVDVMLRELALQPTDLLYDLGCGDGRILIAAVKKYRCRAVGIEIDPGVAERARYRVRRAEADMEVPQGRILIVTGDARRFRLSEATAVTVYLFPELIGQLTPKLRSDVRLASYAHEVPGWHGRRVDVPGCQPVWVVDRRPLTYLMEPVQ